MKRIKVVNVAVKPAEKDPLRPSRLLHTRPKKGKAVNQISSDGSHSAFFDLPPEVRDRIYGPTMGGNTIHVVKKSPQGGQGYALKLPEPNDFATVHTTEVASRFAIGHSLTNGNAFDKLALAFLQTCKQAHWEAALVPFTHNSFVLYHGWTGPSPETKQFLGKTMPAQRRAIRDLQFRFSQGISWAPSAALSAKFASQYPNVTDLTVVLPISKEYGFDMARALRYLNKVKLWPLKCVRVLLSLEDRPGDWHLDKYTKAAIRGKIVRAERLEEAIHNGTSRLESLSGATARL